jgi:hypothetical protein
MACVVDRVRAGALALVATPFLAVACSIDSATEPAAGQPAAAGALTAAQAAALGDEFDGTSLDPSWTVFNPSVVAVSVAGGALHLVAARSSLWFDSSQGALVHKLVAGDFKATTTVHTRKASNPAVAPDQSIELGGVMARSPASPPENYTFIVIGFGEQGHIAVEHKDTVNSSSQFSEVPWTPDAELRLCRFGATVRVYRRHVGDSGWGAPDLETTRPDLPETLQVGLNMYAAETAPDLDVSFDRISFAPVGSLNDCASESSATPVPALVPGARVAVALALAALGALAVRALSNQKQKTRQFGNN